LHTELAEMTEAYRDWRLEDGTDYRSAAAGKLPKPEGVGSEAADALIRILDMSDVYGIQPYDMGVELAAVDRAYPGSGMPETFAGTVAWLHTRVGKLYETTDDVPDRAVTYEMPMVLRSLLGVCDRWGIDLEAEYHRKIAYSRTRPYQHGGRTLADDEALPEHAEIVALGEQRLRTYHPSLAAELPTTGDGKSEPAWDNKISSFRRL
jgi:hypothetical protein